MFRAPGDVVGLTAPPGAVFNVYQSEPGNFLPLLRARDENILFAFACFELTPARLPLSRIAGTLRWRSIALFILPREP